MGQKQRSKEGGVTGMGQQWTEHRVGAPARAVNLALLPGQPDGQSLSLPVYCQCGSGGSKGFSSTHIREPAATAFTAGRGGVTTYTLGSRW